MHTNSQVVVRAGATLAEANGMTFEQALAIARLGCELAANGQLDQARVIFEGLSVGNPHDAAARAALGSVYQKLGRLADARAAYDAALAIDRHNPVALSNRGELRLIAGDKKGFEDLARAAEIDRAGETAAGRRAKALVAAITQRAMKAPHQRTPGIAAKR